jgi:formylglycine-generating enzyme required for sulfatase activity
MLRTHACWITLGAAAVFFAATLGGCGSDDSKDGSDPGKAGSGGTSADSGPDGPSGSGGTGATGGTGGTGLTGGSGGDASVDADDASDGEPDAPEDVVTGDVICTAGTYECNANTLLKCNAQGTQWLDYWNCATSALCDAAGGRCNAPACQPAEHRCEGATLEICKSDQTGWDTKEVCASAAHCRTEFQTCGATPCVAGYNYQCSGSVLQICNATETGWDDVQDCQSSVLCDATNQLCSPSECAPGEISCDGATLRTCNFTLDGWQQLETCQSEQLCDEAGGQCDVCTPDLYRCSGADLYLCSPNGQQETLEASCSSAERCNPGSGRCDPACDSGGPGAGSNCGTGGDEDCCGSPAITGGSFSRSYDVVNYTNDTYVATVADFELDTFEVTVGRFREFVDAGLGNQASPPSAGDGAHPLIADSGWDASWNTELAVDKSALIARLNCDLTFQTWSDTAGANDVEPINCVTWYEAFAYCAWSGGRLPTEAEWNYAASGGDEHRVYPWGDGIDHDLAVWGCETDGVPGCAGDDIVQVGSRSPQGDGRWGQADLAGGMSEWVLDRFQDPYPMPCSNCAAVSFGSGRMRRGGAWNENNANRLRNGSRESANPSQGSTYLGFRCARSTAP